MTVLNDRIYTIDDYLNMDDGNRYELIGGKLIMVPRPRYKHQRIGAKLITAFENFLKQNPIGEVVQEVDVHLGGEVVAPDVLFIAKDRLDIITEMNIQGAPDLVIEVLSPSTINRDKKDKSKIYFVNGVKELWLIDPDQQLVDLFKAGEKEWRWAGVFDREDILTTTLLPGLEIKLGEIFV